MDKENKIIECRNFIERSWNSLFRGTLSVTDIIQDRHKRQVNSLLNKNVTEYFLNSDDIRHIKKHSKDSVEVNGQLPFLLDDALKIPEVLSNPDSVELASYDMKNGLGVRFIKAFSDGRIFTVMIDKFESGELSPKTSYKKPLRGIDALKGKTPNCNARNAQATSVCAKVADFFVTAKNNGKNLQGAEDLELLELEAEAFALYAYLQMNVKKVKPTIITRENLASEYDNYKSMLKDDEMRSKVRETIDDLLEFYGDDEPLISEAVDAMVGLVNYYVAKNN